MVMEDVSCVTSTYLLFSMHVPPPQASHVESEQVLQRRLEEVSEEFRTAQSSRSSLEANLEQAQQDNTALSGQ